MKQKTIGTALALLVIASGAQATSINFFDDPEAMTFTQLPNGWVSFAKKGPYLGPLKGEPTCNLVSRKDMRFDSIEVLCEEAKISPPTLVTFIPEHPRHIHTPFYGTSTSIDRSRPVSTRSGCNCGGGFGGGDSSSGGSTFVEGDIFDGDTIFDMSTTNLSFEKNIKNIVAVKNVNKPIIDSPPVAPIPLPATALMLLSGMLLLRLFRQR